MKTITTKKEYPIITIENLLDNAKKASYIALRTIHQKSGDDKYYILMQAIISGNTQDHDANDILQAAALSLLENITDIENNFILAMKAVNRYIYSLQAVKQTKSSMKTVFIDDPNSADIINVNNEISRLIKDTDAKNAISNIASLLRPTQKIVLRMLAQGSSLTQIADKLKLNKSTVTRHVQTIRQKALTLYPNGINDIIDDVQ